MKKALSIILIAIYITGCKTTVQTQVNLSDLLEGSSKTIPSSLYVEITGCVDHEDSRKISTSLVEVQTEIPKIFQNAEYIECFSKRIHSYAHFKIPIYLNTSKDEEINSTEHLTLISNKNTFLSIAAPKGLRDALAAFEKKTYNSLDLDVVIQVNNNTEKDINFSAVSVFIEDKPSTFNNYTVNKGMSFTTKLSNVSVQSLLAGVNTLILVR